MTFYFLEPDRLPGSHQLYTPKEVTLNALRDRACVHFLQGYHSLSCPILKQVLFLPLFELHLKGPSRSFPEGLGACCFLLLAGLVSLALSAVTSHFKVHSLSHRDFTCYLT